MGHRIYSLYNEETIMSIECPHKTWERSVCVCVCVFKGRGVSENPSSCSLCQPVASLEKVSKASLSLSVCVCVCV